MENESNSLITSNDLINIGKLNNDIKKTAKQIVEKDEPKEIQELISLFNLQEHKKGTLRALKYSELLDRISDEMLARFEKYHNQFSTDDLLRYQQSAQMAIDKSTKANINIEDMPNIIINQVNVAKEEDKLTREERDNVLKALKAIQQFNKEKNNNQEIIIETNKEEENGTIRNNTN